MTKSPAVIRFFNLLLSAFFLVFAAATPAFANNAPGPLAIVSLLSLVVLIVALTFVGGGYRVYKRLQEIKYASKLKRTVMNIMEFIAGVVLFFAGAFMSVFGVLFFSIYAVARGIKLLKWARDAGKDGEKPAHLEGANPTRLKLAGIMLIVLTLLVLGYSVLHLDEVTGVAPYKKKGHAAVLNDEVKKAYNAAKLHLKENPKAEIATCADMEKMGYTPTYRGTVNCFSDMTVSSGEIRMTGPQSWELKKPVASMTFSGEFNPAEP